MGKVKVPVTAAVRVLRAHQVDFEPHMYRYETRGGTAASSAALGVPEHAVIKTLVMQPDDEAPIVVLMHGDFEVATGLLARQIGVKRVTPCAPKVADKHSGYQVGGTSPFGLRVPMRVFAERSIEALEEVWINGGKRGFLLRMRTSELVRVLSPTWVDVCA